MRLESPVRPVAPYSQRESPDLALHPAIVAILVYASHWERARRTSTQRHIAHGFRFPVCSTSPLRAPQCLVPSEQRPYQPAASFWYRVRESQTENFCCFYRDPVTTKCARKFAPVSTAFAHAVFDFTLAQEYLHVLLIHELESIEQLGATCFGSDRSNTREVRIDLCLILYWQHGNAFCRPAPSHSWVPRA